MSADRVEITERLRANLPDDLKQGQVFVLWRYGQPDKRGKLQKPPLQPDGSAASHSNPRTWRDFETAIRAFASDEDGKFEGIGRVLTADDPYTGVDFDNCRDQATGAIDPVTQGLVDLLDSYAEISPSGKGVKVWTTAAMPGDRGRKSKRGWFDVEMYDHLRYFTLTGDHLPGTPLSILSRQSEIDDLFQRVFGKPQPDRPIPKVPELGIEIDLAADVPPLVRKIIRTHRDLLSIWNRDESNPPPGLTDTSPSGWCFVLEDRLVSRGVSPQELTDALVTYRLKHGDKAHPATWYAREVRRAYGRAQSRGDSAPPLAVRRLSVTDEQQLRTFEAAWEHARLIDDLNVRMLLLALCRYSRDGQFAWPSHATLATELHVTEEWISELMRRLISLGCVHIARRPAPRRSTKYELLIYDESHHRLNDHGTVASETVERSANRSQLDGGTIIGERYSQWLGGAAA